MGCGLLGYHRHASGEHPAQELQPLTLDGSYDLVSWSENVTPAAGGRSAELKLAADTEVTVTVAKKPVVMIEHTQTARSRCAAQETASLSP